MCVATPWSGHSSQVYDSALTTPGNENGRQVFDSALTNTWPGDLNAVLIGTQGQGSRLKVRVSLWPAGVHL